MNSTSETTSSRRSSGAARTSVTGRAAQLDGVILAGWRTGASVHVEFDRIPGVPGTIGCAGAPPGATCFVGTIQVGRAPRD